MDGDGELEYLTLIFLTHAVQDVWKLV